MRLKRIVTSALFAAFVCVATAFVKIPLPVAGYVHLGDTFVFLACYFLPTPYAVVAASVGSALADVCAGYVAYAPATLVAKCLMALAFSLIPRRKWLSVLGAAVATVAMTLCYFGYEAVVYGVNVALVNVPFNLLQGAVCAVVALPVARALKRFWTSGSEAN